MAQSKISEFQNILSGKPDGSDKGSEQPAAACESWEQSSDRDGNDKHTLLALGMKGFVLQVMGLFLLYRN